MDILAALRQEETKLQKQADAAKQQLETVRAAIKILGRGVAASNGEPIGKKKRVMSAAGRAKISKATKNGGQSLEQRRGRGNARVALRPSCERLGPHAATEAGIDAGKLGSHLLRCQAGRADAMTGGTVSLQWIGRCPNSLKLCTEAGYIGRVFHFVQQ